MSKPVENPPKIPEKIQWVQPRLVCEVAYAEWTEDEQLRQTTFLGWRDDKRPEEIVLEVTSPLAARLETVRPIRLSIPSDGATGSPLPASAKKDPT